MLLVDGKRNIHSAFAPFTLLEYRRAEPMIRLSAFGVGKGSYAERRSRSGTALTLFIDPIRQPPSAILAGGNRAVLGLALRAIQGDNIAI